MGTGTGRVVVVTGVTRGLGRALVDRFVESDCIVCGCGRSADAIAHLGETYGEPHRFDAVDVSRAGDVSSWANELIGSGCVPDLLINNAGVINPDAALWEVDVADFDRVVDVNVKGVFRVIRSFAPAMIERGSGVIVNFSSGWGRSTSPQVAPYCASKWAIEGLSRSLAQELPAGLGSVAVNPGVIDTDMLRSCFGAGAASYPRAAEWSRRAAPFLLSLTAEDNGASLDVG
ncbi:MAG: SDR family NAD(P)-dependent oxidoreductase [Planctomycetota bacterium]|nr:MAG: SDR family NAD(P)-dependent oxidoreductase [Planctomycetota bacterium]REK38026.1 MAG: SDR family NAD(P)-dependent oxidoreductase [Planctomycetota bacterium]